MTSHGGSPSHPPRPGSSPRRGRWLLLLVPLVLGLGGVLLSVGLIGPPPSAEQSAPGVSPVAAPLEAPSKGPARPPPALRRPSDAPAEPGSPDEAREAERALWQKRYERARFTYDSYREATRYPPESRPIQEQPDQVYPASPERTRPLNKDERGNISLKLKQEKVFVVGEETVRFFVGCENANTHAPLACEVYSGVAHEPPHVAAAGGLTPVPVEFNDSGRNGDEVAGDGTWTASFQPARQGFAMVEGTLRVDFHVRSNGGSEGVAFFDILFTPSPPATFTGKVREAVEQGSLQLYVGLQVRKAGRYVMAGRVDDEAGVPFAYVSFNDELQAGSREVRFTVFGKLIRDKLPDFPLKLRDVDGFLLRENGDPDRELMTSLSGYVYSTQQYAPTAFSEAEWTSEERDRYLAEYGKDLAEAQQHLDELSGKGKAP